MPVYVVLALSIVEDGNELIREEQTRTVQSLKGEKYMDSWTRVQTTADAAVRDSKGRVDEQIAQFGKTLADHSDD